MGDIFAQESFSDANRFTNSLALRYYPTTWLNTRANLGFDFLSRNDKDLVRFDQGPFGETSRQGTVASQRTELDQYTVDLGATGTFTPRTSATGSSSPVAVALALGSCETTSRSVGFPARSPATEMP